MSEPKIRLEEEVLDQVKQFFTKLENDVTLHVFTRQDHCLLCNQVIELIELLTDLSDKLHLELCDCDLNDEKAKIMNIERHPAIVIQGPLKRAVRFFGIPSGFEFRSLIDATLDSSKGDSGLPPETREKLNSLEKSVHIQTFVTPTCPLCPMMVRLTHKYALESEKVTGDMIEATEFMDLAEKYNVVGVPKVITNEDVTVQGMVPEPVFLRKVLEATQN